MTGHGPRFRNLTVKHIEFVGQPLFMARLTVKTRIQSGLAIKAGGIAHARNAQRIMRPTTILLEAVTPAAS
jgi:hypothetical protein